MKNNSLSLLAAMAVVFLGIFTLKTCSDKGKIGRALDIALQNNQGLDSINKWSDQQLQNERGQAALLRAGLIQAQSDLKKYKAQVSTTTNTSIDTVLAPIVPPKIVHDTTCIAVASTFQFSDTPWVIINGTILKDSVQINHVGIQNRLQITIANQRGGFLKKSVPVVRVTNTNPYTKTTEMTNAVVQVKPHRFGIGIEAGVGINDQFKPGYFLGVGLHYSIIRL